MDTPRKHYVYRNGRQRWKATAVFVPGRRQPVRIILRHTLDAPTAKVARNVCTP